jgi:hypothetical protein
MVCLNALTRHPQPQAIQARESAQIRAIKDSIGHVEVFQMDGVAISIIERPRLEVSGFFGPFVVRGLF